MIEIAEALVVKKIMPNHTLSFEYVRYDIIDRTK